MMCGLKAVGAALLLTVAVFPLIAGQGVASADDELAMVITTRDGKTTQRGVAADRQKSVNPAGHSTSNYSTEHSPSTSTQTTLEEPAADIQADTTGETQHSGESQPAGEDESSRAIQHTSSSDHGAGEAAAGGHGNTDAEHGEDQGAVIIRILAHHLVDSETYDLPWKTYTLPKIHVSAAFAEQYPAFVKEHHDEHGTEYYIPVTKHMIGLLVSALLVIILVIPGMGRTRKGDVPHGFGNFLEVLVVFIRDEVIYPNMGEKQGRKWLPFFLTAFFLVLFSNLLGMIPFGTTATGNVNMTGGLALSMLLAVFFAGFRYHGIKYIANFIPHGVPVMVIPILFPIEIFGLFVKHFALCIRLFANMLAGHTVIGVFLALILSPFIALASVPGAVAISMLELFVAFLQSYIFVMLASIFVGSAIHGH